VEKAAADLDTQFAVVYSYGLVHWWLPMGQSVAHCPMDITWFPLDTQNCPFIYESWTMPTTQLNISPLDPSVDLGYYQTSGEWQLVGKDAPVFFSRRTAVGRGYDSGYLPPEGGIVFNIVRLCVGVFVRMSVNTITNEPLGVARGQRGLPKIPKQKLRQISLYFRPKPCSGYSWVRSAPLKRSASSKTNSWPDAYVNR